MAVTREMLVGWERRLRLALQVQNKDGEVIGVDSADIEEVRLSIEQALLDLDREEARKL